MDLFSFLNPADASRLTLTIQRLGVQGVSVWALAGGIAIELQILRCGSTSRMRGLQDVDFVVESFDCIPQALGRDLLLRHVHPHDPPAKMLLQGIDPSTAVRIDVFRAYGCELTRVTDIALAGVCLKMISAQDIIARHARLCWDLVEGKQVAAKYARDFLRLLECFVSSEVQEIWQEHRKNECPESFELTVQELRRAINLRSDLLLPQQFSRDVCAACPRCHPTESFPLADARQVRDILGYC